MAASLAALPLIVLAPPLSRRRLAWALSVVAAASAAGATFDRYRSDRMDVVFASVGQGDATVVRLPGGEVLVVDAGPPGRGRSVVGPTLRRMYIRRIDYLVVTHGQDDHWGGLAELAPEFEIGELWYPGGACDGAFVALLRDLEARGTRIVDVGRARDDRDEARPSLMRRGRGKWRLRALWPRGARGRCDENDRSVVLAVSFARFRVLLTGDIEATAERVLATRRRLRAHLLKVAHHGSRTSSTPAFLAAVRPLAAVASLGSANRFRFPHPEVVGRYERDGTRLYRTDRDGAVQAVITRDALVVAASRAASVRFSRAGLHDRVD